jgi:hypothetical protein
MTQMNKKSGRKSMKEIRRVGPSPDLSAPGFRKPKPDFDLRNYPVPDWIQPGIQAELTGLATTPHMNGQLVTISSVIPQPPEGRIRVVLSTEIGSASCMDRV